MSTLFQAGARFRRMNRIYSIDADGDGVREVHCNTMEGTWTGLRNFLWPFRGVSKWCLSR
jgi:transposase